MGYSVSKQIQKYICESAIGELFSDEMEFDMAYSFVETRNNWIASVHDIQATVKQYVERNEEYVFKYQYVTEFYPMIEHHLKQKDYKDKKGELIKFLRINTELDNNVIEALVNHYLNELI